jgi:hypothetical protein
MTQMHSTCTTRKPTGKTQKKSIQTIKVVFYDQSCRYQTRWCWKHFMYFMTQKVNKFFCLLSSQYKKFVMKFKFKFMKGRNGKDVVHCSWLLWKKSITKLKFKQKTDFFTHFFGSYFLNAFIKQIPECFTKLFHKSKFFVFL